MSVRRLWGFAEMPVRVACAVLLLAVLAACTGDPQSPTAPPPTQPLNLLPPTATAPVIVPTATLTSPPSAADVALTATRLAPTLDATEQVRQSQRRLALETVSEANGIPVAALNVISITGVRAGREIADCGRARSGMALVHVLHGEDVTELLISGETASICATVNIYDERPELFLTIDPIAADFTALAVQRAARAAAVETSEVVIVSVRPMIWQDALLGCDSSAATPEPGASSRVSGYRIVLSANETEYIYHTDFDRIVPCVTA